ncbi:tetratricopeptide repeat protein [Pseudahrensia aquimaris]|uniref:Tetratricopeptide repeat protein n=1 Tax=Pseudahrensia aquimaris TaxID=744461 RepID=A0ABW3FB54_9HYPH
MRFRVLNLALILSASVASGVYAQSVQTDPNGDLAPRPEVEEQTAPAKTDKIPALFKLGDDLDTLFSQLKRTANKGRAKRISDRIWELWRDSENDSVDLLAAWARAAMQKRQFSAALDLLDQMVVLQPDHPEGWNQRATLHFMMDNYSKSIADIERTLALEPRHFGALAGLANMQARMGDDKAALKTWYRVLDVYPAMESAQKSVIRLEEKLAGQSL